MSILNYPTVSCERVRQFFYFFERNWKQAFHFEQNLPDWAHKNLEFFSAQSEARFLGLFATPSPGAPRLLSSLSSPSFSLLLKRAFYFNVRFSRTLLATRSSWILTPLNVVH